MILTDEDILKSIKNGDIEITPFNKSRLGSNSYDVTLSEHLLMYTEEILDAKKDNEYERFTIPDEGHILFPGKIDENLVLNQAKIHYTWDNKTAKELVLSTKKIKVYINKEGILIDSFVVPISVFTDGLELINNFKIPFIVTHKAVIRDDIPFLTIGCADYSVKDIELIISTYKQNQ